MYAPLPSLRVGGGAPSTVAVAGNGRQRTSAFGTGWPSTVVTAPMIAPGRMAPLGPSGGDAGDARHPRDAGAHAGHAQSGRDAARVRARRVCARRIRTGRVRTGQ